MSRFWEVDDSSSSESEPEPEPDLYWKYYARFAPIEELLLRTACNSEDSFDEDDQEDERKGITEDTEICPWFTLNRSRVSGNITVAKVKETPTAGWSVHQLEDETICRSLTCYCPSYDNSTVRCYMILVFDELSEQGYYGCIAVDSGDAHSDDDLPGLRLDKNMGVDSESVCP